MAQVSTYLNFSGDADAAFNFYIKVFNTQYLGNGTMYFRDLPSQPGMPEIPEEEKNQVMHTAILITGGHILMGSDAPKSMGFNLTKGNNVHIMLSPDSKEETKRLFDALSEGGQIVMPLQDTFWGSFHGGCVDKFGIGWMFDFNLNNQVK